MVCINNVTYYSLEEIAAREGFTPPAEGLVSFLEANPTYGRKIDGRWHSYDLAIGFMGAPGKRATSHLAGALGFDFTGLSLPGLVLDIGAGGEGIIGQVAGSHAVGIAPEEHRRGLEAAPGCGLKVMMDARDMKFLDNSFDTATAFFTLMYIPTADHRQVFSEVHRVLKPGGTFLLWDMAIPENTTEKTSFVLGIEVRLPEKTVLTGYGTGWAGRVQSLAIFKALAEDAGFQVVEEKEEDHLVYLKLVKLTNPSTASIILSSSPSGK